jgi:hypothetical protein
MKINTSQVQLSGRQHNTLASTKLERLSVKVLEQNADTEAGGNKVNTASINLSMTNKTSEKQSIETQSSVRSLDSGEEIKQHAGLQLANYVVEKSSELTLSVAQVSQVLSETNGVEINNQSISAARSMDVEAEVLSLLTQESQQGLTFEALGQVTTDDGREINFMLALDFERSIHNEQINKFVGNRNLIDPLMINLKGGAVEFSDLTFEFDLNADGEMDSIAQTASGSGFIVFDKNQNGVIDDGSEMFGPQSGQGFAELSQYDDDGNGWIDENDAIYTELGVMSFTDSGRETQSLMAAEVGAIYLGSIASDYELNTESGFLAGNLKQSGVALSEDGRALLMQEVHLVDYYIDGDRRDSALAVITELESESQNLLRLDSPLNLFQIVDPIIDLRDAQTRVTISSPESAHIEAVFNIELSQVNPETYGLAQQTFDRAQIAEELSNWVASAMVDFEPRSNSKAQVASIDIASISVEAQAPVFDQALTDMDLEKMKLDSKLGTMRSMIESLRNMQQLASDSSNRASLYHRIGTFK